MANYPPTPSFGGPFNFPPQWPPHSSAPRPTYQGERLPVPPPVLHGPSNHSFVAPNANSKPQIPGLGGNNGNVPIPPPPHFPFHYHNQKFPPPPYFPGTTSQEGLPSPFTRPLDMQSNGHNGGAIMQSTGGEAQEGKEYQSLPGFENTHPPPFMDVGTREEGELSDGELESDKSPTSGTQLAENQKQSGPKKGASRNYLQNGVDGVNNEGKHMQLSGQ